MKTKLEIIAELKAQYPTLRTGDEENGYTDLEATEYNATIDGWADNAMIEETKLAEAEQVATDKAALLAKLGISQEEATLLLS